MLNSALQSLKGFVLLWIAGISTTRNQTLAIMITTMIGFNNFLQELSWIMCEKAWEKFYRNPVQDLKYVRKYLCQHLYDITF